MSNRPHSTGATDTEGTDTGGTASSLPPALILTGLLLLAANLRTAITSVGPVLGIIQRDQHLSSVAASVLVSVPLVAFAAFSPIAVRIGLRFGLERTLAGSLALLAAGIVLRSIPPQPLLWAGSALLGIAIAIMNVLLPSLVKRDFPTRIGPITGAYTAIQSGAAAIAAGLAVPLAGHDPSGWRFSLGVWAAFALVGLGCFAPQLLRNTGADLPSAADRRHTRTPWGSALAWQVTAFMGLQSFAFYVLVAWLSSIEQSFGISPATAGFHQLLLNLCGLLGSFGGSALIHRLPDQRVLAIITSVLFVGALAGLLFAPGLAAGWSSLAGLSGGCSLVLALSLFGLRTRDHEQAGALSGMAQSVGYGLAALGPIAVGAIHDATASWTLVLVIMMALAVVQAVVGVLAARPRTIA